MILLVTESKFVQFSATCYQCSGWRSCKHSGPQNWYLSIWEVKISVEISISDMHYLIFS